ncbi:MAG: hypothetical protein KDD33_12410 [Bdellovibrionales bacterium]|nr:hypothetical protein [Bdellovibrionales bacterium]
MLFIPLLFAFEGAQAKFGSIVDVGLAGDFYFSKESANNGQAFANLLIRNDWSDSQFYVDVGGGGLIADSGHTYIKAPQFYYRGGSKQNLQWTLGRSLHNWSFLDSHWHMGLTQPLFLWNGAHPEEQGLTGAFLTIPLMNDTFEVTAFASYLFIPTQGASYEFTDGKITSSNPWFVEPVQAVSFSGNRIDLNYQLNTPKTQDVVFRASYGLSIGTPMNRKGWLINAFYLNKPANDLVLPFTGGLNLSTSQGDIDIRPEVARHQVTGLDAGWSGRSYKFVASWLHEFEHKYAIPADSTYPILPDQDIFSLGTRYLISHSQRIWLSYLHVDRKKTGIEGLFSSAQIDTYVKRNRFEKALQLKWQGLLFKSSRGYSVKSMMALYFDPDTDNTWITSDFRWAALANTEVFVQCDLFGSSHTEYLGKDFISTYQNNDRCLVGGHYAF